MFTNPNLEEIKYQLINYCIFGITINIILPKPSNFHFLKNFTSHLSTPSALPPYSLPSPLRETWCAPGIREGRRCRIGRMTVCGWVMSPQVRALIGAFSVIAAPDEARPPDGRPQGRIIILNERPNGRPSSRPLNRGLLFDNGQGRKGSVAMNRCNRPPLGNGSRTFVSRFARK